MPHFIFMDYVYDHANPSIHLEFCALWLDRSVFFISPGIHRLSFFAERCFFEFNNLVTWDIWLSASRLISRDNFICSSHCPASREAGQSDKNVAYKHGALTICTEKTFYSDEMSNGMFNLGKIFRNRRNAFEGIPLFTFQPKWPR